MTEPDSLMERRKRSPYVQALNMAYGLLMDHSVCLAEDVDLDGFAVAIAKVILDGPPDHKR